MCTLNFHRFDKFEIQLFGKVDSSDNYNIRFQYCSKETYDYVCN